MSKQGITLRLSFLFVLLFSFNTFAGHVWLPKEITVVTINGQPYPQSFFASETNLELTPGQQLLVLEYKDIFENYDDDDHTRIKSEPFVVIFTVGEQDKLTVKLPAIAGEEQAREFAGKFNIQLLDASNKAHPVFIQDLMKYKAGRLVNAPVFTSANMHQEVSGEQNSGKDSDALVQLKHWWQLASEKQKRYFMQYLLLQEQASQQSQTEGVTK